jgi:copper chaperone CopZ
MSDRLRFRVEGMDCGSCARKIETALTRVAGVSDISISTTTETLRLRAAEAGTGEQVEKVVRDLGYVGKEIMNHIGAVKGRFWIGVLAASLHVSTKVGSDPNLV